MRSHYLNTNICIWNSIYCFYIKKSDASYQLIPLFEYYNILRLTTLIKKSNTIINIDLTLVDKEFRDINDYIRLL